MMTCANIKESPEGENTFSEWKKKKNTMSKAASFFSGCQSSKLLYKNSDSRGFSSLIIFLKFVLYKFYAFTLKLYVI